MYNKILLYLSLILLGFGVFGSAQALNLQTATLSGIITDNDSAEKLGFVKGDGSIGTWWMVPPYPLRNDKSYVVTGTLVDSVQDVISAPILIVKYNADNQPTADNCEFDISVSPSFQLEYAVQCTGGLHGSLGSCIETDAQNHTYDCNIQVG